MRSSQQPFRIRSASSFDRYGSTFAFLCGMASLGFLAQFQWVGYIVILLYSMTVIVKRVSVRTTYIAALLALGMVVVAVILANWTVAQNFASYSFLLLVFGAVMTVVDLYREPRKSK